MTSTPTLDALIAQCVTDPTAHIPLCDEMQEEGCWTFSHVQQLVFDHPESDGFRLLAAEWFDRAAEVRVKCLQCDGTGEWEDAQFRDMVTDCKTCSGTGTVRDNTLAARAEFIRLAIELGL